MDLQPDAEEVVIRPAPVASAAAVPEAGAPGGEVAAAKGRGRGGRGRGRRRGQAQARSADGDDVKKCKDCKQELPISAFNADQAACKGCFNQNRNIRNLAIRQKELQWFEGLDEQQMKELAAAYNKEKALAEKERRKINFSIKSYKESLEASTGARVEGRRRMMWYGQYKEWAMSSEGGYLSVEEIDHNWNKWKTDVDRVEDQKGPRNALRLAVHVADELVDYNDVALKRSLEQEQKLGKNASAEDVAKRIKAGVLSGHEDSALGDIGHLKRSLAQASARVGGSAGASSSASTFAGSDFNINNLQDMLAKHQENKRARKAGQAEQAVDVDQGEDHETLDEAPPTTGVAVSGDEQEGGSPGKWVAIDSAKAKADRLFVRMYDQLVKKIDDSLTEMHQKLDLARAVSGAANLTAEIKILIKRIECVNIIRSGSKDDYKAYCEKIKQPDASDSASTNSAGSANMAAVAVSGPCNDFERLLTVQDFAALKNAFNTALTVQDITNNWKVVNAANTHINELLASCRTAMADLKSAMGGAGGGAAKPKQGAKAKAAGAKAKATAKGKAKVEEEAYQITVLAPSCGTPVPQFPLNSLPEGAVKGDVPFLVTGVTWLKDELAKDSAIKKELDEFKKSFEVSDIKLVSGKAQLPFSEGCAEGVRAQLAQIFAQATVDDANSVKKADHPKLQAALIAGSFGSAAKHRSVKYEWGGLACLRLSSTGDRQVAILRPDDVCRFLTSSQSQGGVVPSFSSELARQWATHVNQEKLEAFVSFGGKCWFADVQPEQVLYIPSGFISCEGISKDADNYGVKACFVVHSDSGALTLLRQFHNENKAAGRVSPTMEELIGRMEHIAEEARKKQAEESGAAAAEAAAREAQPPVN